MTKEDQAGAATVTFEDNWDRIPMPARVRAESTIQRAIQSVRPAHEVWQVSTHEPQNKVDWTVTFTMGGKTDSLLLKGAEADAGHEHFMDALTMFLREWPATRD